MALIRAYPLPHTIGSGRAVLALFHLSGFFYLNFEEGRRIFWNTDVCVQGHIES
jgi:hypothetical protein